MQDLKGRIFGRLKAVAYVGHEDHRAVWRCRCECGKHALVQDHRLLRGNTQSCGCLYAERVAETHTTHGHSKRGKWAPEYRSWVTAKQRCFNPKATSFNRYGGRGIGMCERWRASYESFLEDMGPRPKGCTLDRIDNDGNYCPDNCRWATRKQQTSNRNKYKSPGMTGRLNHQSKLTEGDVATIRLLRGIVSQKDLARRFDVSKTAIRQAQLGRTWSHI